MTPDGDLRPKLGDLRQFASVRRIVLDDGPERGVRALAFSTGGGLDFWILSDRSMDIGPLWLRGVQIGWQSPAGFASPALLDAESEDGRGFNRGFSGFLVTCGMRHIRQPRDGHPLHGRLPYTPAKVTAYGEDWNATEPVLYTEGEILESSYGGEALRLRRRIEAPIGGRMLRIRDTVENIAADAVPHEMLYHFNLGWPAVQAGASVSLDGEDLLGPLAVPEPEIAPARTWPCAAPTAKVRVTAGPDSGPFIDLDFRTDSLTHLQLWRDLRPRVGVLSIEPCTSRNSTGEPAETAPPLASGDRRDYGIDIEFSGDPRA